MDGQVVERRDEPVPRDEALEAATTLARWLDHRFVDPLLGLLLPGVGDLISSALGLYPVLLAWRRRAPKALLARMSGSCPDAGSYRTSGTGGIYSGRARVSPRRFPRAPA